MAKTVLNKTYWATQEFLDASRTVVLTASGRIISDGGGIHLSPSGENGKVIVDGEIFAEDTAVQVEGDNSRVTIGKTGSLFGDFGIVFSGNGSRGVNNGTLIADDDIVHLGGTNMKFTNNGVMRGEDGVKFAGDGSVFTNGAKGVIEVWDNAVQVESVAGETTKTINKGMMMNNGWPTFFLGGASDDTFINKGRANGVINLGDGNDVFDNRGGKLNGVVFGGAGDDRVYTDKASLSFVELAGGGDDTVFSTVSFTLAAEVERLTLIGKKAIDGTGNTGANVMTGNNAANTLSGLAGADMLDGGRGNDTLTGGADRDTFVFATRYGQDTITDFVIGSDSIDLTNWKAITDFIDLKENHAEDRNGNVEITAGRDKLILIGVSKDDLLEGDFHFQFN